jgi:Pterin-4a-carbinolamine dehydratase
MTLDGWREEHDAYLREFTFADFSEAFAFLTRVAMLCEAHDHHAEITNVYNRVTLRLTTHDEGGISERDVKLGQAINLLI